MSETRICRKCGRELPLTKDYFYPRKDNGKVGFKNTCKACCKNRDLERYYENRDRINEERREKYQQIREVRLQKQRDYYHNGGGKEVKVKYHQDNREKISNRRKRHYYENRERLLTEKKDVYWNHGGREKRSEKDKLNRDAENARYRAYYRTETGRLNIITAKNRRWSKKNNLLATLTSDEWQETLEYFDNTCAYCGAKGETLQRDHALPLSKGGYYVQSNIIPACKSCNSSKHDRDMETWFKQQLFFSESRLNRILNWTRLNAGSDTQQLSMF